jgi:hypothetical protein
MNEIYNKNAENVEIESNYTKLMIFTIKLLIRITKFIFLISNIQEALDFILLDENQKGT